MLSMDLLLSGLENRILLRTSSQMPSRDATGILLATGTETLSEAHIYVGDPVGARALLQNYSGGFLTLIVAGQPIPLPVSDQVRAAFVSIPLPELYNTVYGNFTRWQSWKEQLKRIPLGPDGVRKLLQVTRSLAEQRCAFYFLSPEYRVIAACGSEDKLNQITRRLQSGGFITEAQLALCFTGSEDTSGEGQVIYRLEPVAWEGRTFGHLLAIGEIGAPGFEDLVALLRRQIVRHLTREEGLDADPHRQRLTQLMEDIFLFIPNDVETLRSRLDALPNPPGRYIRSVVMEFRREVPMPQILEELDAIFPGANIAPYSSYVVALLSGDTHLFLPEFDKERLETLLLRYSGYAVISNAASYLRGLRTLYLQCKSTLPLLPGLTERGGNRCVYYEHMREFHVISLCAGAIAEEYGHDQLVYLAHPAVIELLQYDKAHGTDYVDALSAYVNSNFSLVRASEELGIHRNTLVYRLNKIQDLLKVDLQDFLFRRELFFSFQLMTYTRRVQNREFILENSPTENLK